MATEKAEFLRKCALSLNSDTYMKKLLKSHYMNTSLSVAHQSPILSQMCPYCASFWNESEYKLKLSRTANLHRLTKEFSKLNEAQKENRLNKKKRLRLKWLQKQIARLKIECKFCQKVSSIAIEKAKKKQTNLSETANAPKASVVESIVTTLKKKKKRKDKTAGLKIPTNNTNDKKKPSSAINPATAKSNNAALKNQHMKLKNSFQIALQRQSAKEQTNPLSALLK